MCDHDGQTELLQDRNRLRQTLHVDPKLQMPTEFGHDGCQLLSLRQWHAAPIMQLAVAEKMIEAQATDAGRVRRFGPYVRSRRADRTPSGSKSSAANPSRRSKAADANRVRP